MTGGKKQKLNFKKVLEAGSKEVNGPGITVVEVEIAAYGKKRFLFTASANSAMDRFNTKPASLSGGFSIQWSPDPDKDKEGKV